MPNVDENGTFDQASLPSQEEMTRDLANAIREGEQAIIEGRIMTLGEVKRLLEARYGATS